MYVREVHPNENRCILTHILTTRLSKIKPAMSERIHNHKTITTSAQVTSGKLKSSGSRIPVCRRHAKHSKIEGLMSIMQRFEVHATCVCLAVQSLFSMRKA